MQKRKACRDYVRSEFNARWGTSVGNTTVSVPHNQWPVIRHLVSGRRPTARSLICPYPAVSCFELHPPSRSA